MVGKDTIIIISIAAAVLSAILVFIVFRLFKKIVATSQPLPPVQPLAHHREQQLAKFENTLSRSQTWYNSQSHLIAPDSVSARASRVSLIAKNSPSCSPIDSAYSPLSYDHSLPVPSPPFHSARPASSSSAASSDRASQPPITAESSPRPLSISSSHSTLYSKNSRHTLRGTPHGPHSQIQIVLPTPLAAELSVSGDLRRNSRIDDGGSIADRWLSPGTPSEESPRRVSPSSSSTTSNIPPVPQVPSTYMPKREAENNEKQET